MTQTNDLMSDVIRETLGPDVTIDSWNGQIMPYDAVYERRISAANTASWWANWHRNDTLYHQRYRGYCPHCQGGN